MKTTWQIIVGEDNKPQTFKLHKMLQFTGLYQYIKNPNMFVWVSDYITIYIEIIKGQNPNIEFFDSSLWDKNDEFIQYKGKLLIDIKNLFGH